MPVRHTVSVTVRRPTGTNRYGDTAGYTEFRVGDCVVAPSSGDSGRPSSNELNGMRNTVITGFQLYAPFGTDIRATDQVLLPGDLEPWEVDGEVAHWQSPYTGWRPGTVVSLRRVRG